MFFSLVCAVSSVDFIPYQANSTDGRKVDIKCFKISDTTAAIGTNSTTPAILSNETGSLTFPETVEYEGKTYTITEIGEYAFYESKICGFVLDGYTKINAHAFEKVVTINSFQLSSKCKEICESAFRDTKFTYFKFNEDIEKLGVGAFYNAQLEGLIDFEKTKIKVIEKNAFYNSKLRTFVTPTTIETIEEGAFSQNDELEEAIFHPNLKEIGNYAFANCVKLAQLDLSETNVRSIGVNAFQGTTFLQSIKLSNVTDSIGKWAFQGTGATSINLEDTKLTELNESLFFTASLEKVSLPQGLKRIGNKAFKRAKIKAIIIPSSLKSIGHGSFSECENLESIDLSETKNELIEKYAFFQTTSLTTVKFSSYLKQINAFSFKNSGIESVVFPATLTTIEESAFNNSKLKTIDFSKSQVDSIPQNCFSHCQQITDVKLGSVKTIEREAFHSSSIRTIVFPPTFTTLESHAFEECTALQSVDMSNCKLTEISESAFSKIPTLTDIKWPTSAFTIGEHAFSETGIKNLTLGPKCSKVGKHAFSSCPNLEEVDMSTASFGKIDDSVFLDSTSLKRIAFSDLLSSIGKNSLPNSLKEVYYCGTHEYKGNYSATLHVRVPYDYISSKFGSAEAIKVKDFPYTVDFHSAKNHKSSWVGWVIAMLVLLAVAITASILYFKYKVEKGRKDEGYLISQEESYDTKNGLFT